MATKKQKIVHLTQREWVLHRPDTFVGPLEPAEASIPHFLPDGTVEWETVVVCPALVHLCNELVVNAVDNAFRADGGSAEPSPHEEGGGGSGDAARPKPPAQQQQHYIKLSVADGGAIKVVNDGPTLPMEYVDGLDRVWAPTAAFGVFQTGSNFDDEEERLTAGRNGIGCKAVNVLGKRFEVHIVNADAKKAFDQVWTDNMSVAGTPSIRASSRKTNETGVVWVPDDRLVGPTPVDAPSFASIVEWLAHNAALCAPPHVKVYWQNQLIKVRTPEQYCKALGGRAPFATDAVVLHGRTRLRVCVAASDTPSVVAFVNSTPCNEGSHVQLILQAVANIVEAKAKSRRGAARSSVNVTPSLVKSHVAIVAVVNPTNPTFGDQLKRRLVLPASQWVRGGFKWEPSPSFVSSVERSDLVDVAVASTRQKEDAAAAKAMRQRGPVIPNYEPALKLYGPKTTIIVTEGKSAKAFAVAGLSVVGRHDYGVFPIRGKLLNVRGLTAKSMADNEEVRALLQILGVQPGVEYTATSKLPYAHLMIMTDMDTDGAHIAGLLCNLVDVVAPSLLRARPHFLQRFATSLIRVSLGRGAGDVLGFYSQPEYDAWYAARVAAGQPTGAAKYYKGLGTSSNALAKEYFRRLRENTVTIVYDSDGAEKLDLLFNPKRTDDRKAWILAHSNSKAYVDYNADKVTLTSLVEDEILPQYAMNSLRRAIPSVIDGLKEATRKVFWGARLLKANHDTKVFELATDIVKHSHYHHGDASIVGTIVGMACNYSGAPNINLLVPQGQFGSRHSHVPAAARYIGTCLHAPLHALLFPPRDDAVLTPLEDEGATVEFAHYVPVIPTVLCFGAKGIATGWNTECPMYRPTHVLAVTRAWMDGGGADAAAAAAASLVPWFRHFGGTVVADDGGDDFLCHGVATLHDGGEYHVTEVPPVKETDAYVDEWRKRGWTVCVGGDHTDERVHLIVKGPPEGEPWVIEKKLTLKHLHLLGADGTLRKYTIEEIFATHGAERLALYAKRLAHEVQERTRDMQVASRKARFIDACIAGEFNMCAHEDDAAALEALKDIDLDDASLLKMPMASLTRARAAQLRAQRDAIAREIEALRSTTPRDAWKADLDALEAHLREAQL